LDKLKIEPRKIWMIGDSALEDIGGARKFGMTTIQKVHQNVKVGEGESKPDIVFNQYESLLDFFHQSFSLRD